MKKKKIITETFYIIYCIYLFKWATMNGNSTDRDYTITKFIFPLRSWATIRFPLLCAIDNRQCRQTWIQNSFSHECLPSFHVLYTIPYSIQFSTVQLNLLLFYIYIYKAEFYRTLLNKMISFHVYIFGFYTVYIYTYVHYISRCVYLRYNVYS